MAALAILIPAILGAVAAFMMRARLRSLLWLPWMGWTLLGAGAPVLAGQLVALALVGDGAPPPTPGATHLIREALAAGLSGGLGWVAGALSVRLAPRRS